MMTSMIFLTLPYNCVTISFLPEIWFGGPTHPTFLYNVTLLFFFLLKASLSVNNSIFTLPTVCNFVQPMQWCVSQ